VGLTFHENGIVFECVREICRSFHCHDRYRGSWCSLRNDVEKFVIAGCLGAILLIGKIVQRCILKCPQWVTVRA
jgi:hypothetical protein